MKHFFTTLFCMTAVSVAVGQTTEKEIARQNEEAANTVADSTINEGWKAGGKVSLLFNQSSFSNWVAGGENNISGNLSVNYDFNFHKKDITWDNKIVGSYGLIKTRNASYEKKTDDRLEFNSVFGKEAFGEWHYSFFLNFRTQFTKGYIYSTDEFGKEIRNENTDFLSPGYLTFGPGMYWKKNDNLKVNFAPLTSKLTFVDDFYTSLPGYVDGSYFGVDANKMMRYELGFYVSSYYKFNLMTNVSLENTLNLYSNYLENPEKIDLDYSLAVFMKINRNMSANFAFQAIYDENAIRRFQTRQVFGLGVNFGF